MVGPQGLELEPLVGVRSRRPNPESAAADEGPRRVYQFRQKGRENEKPLELSRGFGDSVEYPKSAAPLCTQQTAEAFGQIRLG